MALTKLLSVKKYFASKSWQSHCSIHDNASVDNQVVAEFAALTSIPDNVLKLVTRLWTALKINVYGFRDESVTLMTHRDASEAYCDLIVQLHNDLNQSPNYNDKIEYETTTIKQCIDSIRKYQLCNKSFISQTFEIFGYNTHTCNNCLFQKYSFDPKYVLLLDMVPSLGIFAYFVANDVNQRYHDYTIQMTDLQKNATWLPILLDMFSNLTQQSWSRHGFHWQGDFMYHEDDNQHNHIYTVWISWFYARLANNSHEDGVFGLEKFQPNKVVVQQAALRYDKFRLVFQKINKFESVMTKYKYHLGCTIGWQYGDVIPDQVNVPVIKPAHIGYVLGTNYAISQVSDLISFVTSYKNQCYPGSQLYVMINMLSGFRKPGNVVNWSNDQSILNNQTLDILFKSLYIFVKKPDTKISIDWYNVCDLFVIFV